MRKVLLACATLALTVPLIGQVPAQQGKSKMEQDPDKKVEGGGTLPTGWQARLDRPTGKLEDLKFVTMGTGFHVTTGPATILFNPAKTGKGDYTAKATFTQTKATPHREAYGLFIGGADLSGEGQRYTYFEVSQTGEYFISRREGAQTKAITAWTANPAVKKPDADGKVTNALSIVASKDTVKFLVNGTEAASQPRSAVDADGLVGLRVNHNLDVHIEGFTVTAGTSH